MIDGDVKIKQAIGELRFATIPQLREYLGRSKIHRRLQVDPPKPLVREKHVYVAVRGSNDPYVFASYDISKRRTFEHELMITAIHIVLYKTGRLAEYSWQQPKVKRKGALNEDASCTLLVQSAGGRAGKMDYYIEADTGSENPEQVIDRVKRYLRWYQDAGRRSRLLVVTASESRIRHIVKQVEQFIPEGMRKLFLFTTLESLQSNPLGAICRAPHEKESHSILPA